MVRRGGFFRPLPLLRLPLPVELALEATDAAELLLFFFPFSTTIATSPDLFRHGNVKRRRDPKERNSGCVLRNWSETDLSGSRWFNVESLLGITVAARRLPLLP